MAVILLSELQALWITWADSQIEKVELYNKLEYYLELGSS